jgi:hypothetical protein
VTSANLFDALFLVARQGLGSLDARARSSVFFRCRSVEVMRLGHTEGSVAAENLGRRRNADGRCSW